MAAIVSLSLLRPSPPSWRVVPHFRNTVPRFQQCTLQWQPRMSFRLSSCGTFKVEIEHKGERHVLEVEEDETILEKALEAGIDVPHDCKLGVCMTCPAKLEQGTVDQSGGMLSDDVKDKGYALLCSSLPRSDCKIRTIPEDELLNLQLVT